MTEFKEGDRFVVVQQPSSERIIRVGHKGTVVREKIRGYIRGRVDGVNHAHFGYYPFYESEIERIDPDPAGPELEDIKNKLQREVTALVHLMEIEKLLRKVHPQSAESVLAEIKEYLDWRTGE